MIADVGYAVNKRRTSAQENRLFVEINFKKGRELRALCKSFRNAKKTMERTFTKNTKGEIRNLLRNTMNPNTPLGRA